MSDNQNDQPSQDNHQPINPNPPEYHLSPEQLALMASDIPELEEEIEEIKELEPSVVTTSGSAFDRVGVKTLIVGGGTLLVVLTIALTGQGFTSILSNNQEKPPKVARQPQPNPREQTQSTEKKANAPDQTAQLEKLNSKLLNPNSTPVPTPVKPLKAPNTKVSPVITTKPVQISKMPRAAGIRPKIKYASVPVRTPAPFPVAQETETVVIPPQLPLQKPAKPLPKPAQAQRTQKIPLPQETESEVQPQPQQEAIQEVIAVKPSTTDTQNKEGEKDTKIEAETLSSQHDSIQPAIEIKVTQPSSQSLVVGTFAEGKVESAIVLSRSLPSHNSQPTLATALKVNKNHLDQLAIKDNPLPKRTFPIKLTQELRNPDGTVIIPKDSLLITQVQSATSEGGLELSAVSFVTKDESGFTVEKPIPEGAILVLARDGSPLRAEVKTLENKNDTSADYPKTARLSRLPVRHGIPPLSNSSSLSSSFHDSQNYPDSKGEILRRALDKHKSKNTAVINTFSLKKGTQIQVYVNRSFSLN